MQIKKQHLELDMEQWTNSKLGKEYIKAIYFHPAYLTYMQNAAAAVKSLQSCPTLCDPIDGSPSDSSVPGILEARILEWVSISLSNAWKWKVKVSLFSHVRLFAAPWTVAYQAPPSMGFSRQEYWSGLPFPSPYMQNTLCKILGWVNQKLGSILPVEVLTTSDTEMMSVYWQKLKSLLIRVKEESEKSWLKVGH